MGVGALFVIYGLAPAGPELRLLDFARQFPGTIDVHVCVIGDDLTLLPEFQKTRARILHVPMSRPYVQWARVQKVCDYIAAHDIRVINSFDLKTLLVCAAAKVRYGSRVKLVHHLISLWDGVPSHHRRIIWNVLRFADQVLCNGYAVREHVIGARRLSAPVSIIPNGVDCDYFHPMPDARAFERQRLGFGDGHFVLGTVGNVRPVKNYPFLLNTMQSLSATYPHARLLCVGGGPQLDEMKGLTRSLGLADRVVFTGMTKDVRPFVAAMDAFALCSLKEGNPNVVLQAMAMATPVVSFGVGEVPSVIEDGISGLVVNPGDAGALLAAIARLAGDPKLRRRLGDEARRRVSGRYSSSQMIANYAALMKQTAA
jgi:glycosyltransferase involved in cell wall biosynthesis